MKITITAIIERQRPRFYIHKKQKQLPNVFLHKKPDTFQKPRQFLLRFIYKKPYTFRYGFFLKCFEVRIYLQKHDTLRNVTFLHTNI